jgi:DNA gyrase subunit A
MQMEIGTVKAVDIEQEMRGAYLDYAMSVIVARALPDARDGLKPVHRRILYAMHDMGLRSSAAYKKSARIVGEVLGKYHPHGDAAVYDAMARMAQVFSLRYPLVDGQGNFGSVDGDAPAAMRYTEARLAAIAEELMQDIGKETVDFVPNFDDTLHEPSVFPAKLPNLLLNGTSGIAVGMATNIPPHNLGELCDAINYVIDHYDELDEVTVEDLMQFIKGPDFPTGGLILGDEGIRQAYATGRGRIVMRAMTHIEEMRGNRHRLVVTELPYQVNKAGLLERIANLVREGRLADVSDLRDESDRRGMSVVIELKRGAQPDKVLNQLFKHTVLQGTFGANILALVDGTPRTLSLKRALEVYVEHRREVITRRTEYDLARARHRAHILEGLLTALNNLDAVIETIRQSPDAETARTRLMERFELSEIQAQAILDMQLRRLAALERQKIEDEYTNVIQEIAYLEDLLANPRKILYLVKEDLAELRETYADARRTRITADLDETIEAEDLVPEEVVLISITRRGYVKRTPVKAYRAQARGGKGVSGMSVRDEDAVQHLFAANSLASLLFFSNRGKVFQEKVYQLPDAQRQARGIPLANLLSLARGERITAALPVDDFEAPGFLTMATRRGRIKRIALSEFVSVRRSGLVAIKLASRDELGWVKLTDGDSEVILVTEQGKALRFSEEIVRPQGRTAAGVWAIRLADGDAVASMDVVEPQGHLLVATAQGYGKRTLLSEYPAKGRHGGGVVTLHQKYIAQTGIIVAARVVGLQDQVTLITTEGVALRTDVASFPEQGRTARGKRIMDLQDQDTVISLARLEGDTSEGEE